jgi:hypothetical protein
MMERHMSLMNSPNLLRYALTVDAIASGASAVLLLAGAGYLTELLGLPVELMRVAGIILVPFVALVGYLATRAEPSPGAVWAVILINIAWVVGSAYVLFGGVVSPTGLGFAFVAVQAIAVLIFADFQFFGLRNTAAHA